VLLVNPDAAEPVVRKALQNATNGHVLSERGRPRRTVAEHVLSINPFDVEATADGTAGLTMA
jgi:hypothetical protein